MFNTQDSVALEQKVEYAEPLVHRIVSWRLHLTASLQDREDVIGDVLLELLSRQDAVRRGESEPIADFGAYAAVASHHGCDRYLRRRFPQRYQLATRIRYLLEKSSAYSVWQEGDSLACGIAEWQGRAVRMDLSPGWCSQVPLAPRATETRAVAAVFDYLQAPLRLPDLVHGIAALMNVHDQTVSATDLDIAARAEHPEMQLHYRRTLGQLWQEIALLPRHQRVALLLNLRDEEGACALTSLPATGVASLREIARVLEIPAEELAGIWGRLPLSDLEIAAKLAMSRQQVINLRKTARQRLARRMAGNIDRKPDS